jgi:hypothetical protein
MSEFEITVHKLLESMVADKKITGNEAQKLQRILVTEENFNRVSRLHKEDEIAHELLTIISEASIKVVIPTHGSQDDLSSPLDAFLLSKKKETDRQTINSGNSIAVLVKID